MTTPPARPKLYHITHVDNLRAIVAHGGLLSDADMIARGGPAQAIGMTGIKRRRVEDLEVDCHPGTKVGDYVPFYFCPRSVMLFVIQRANHPELTYRGGQGPIVHLQADLHAVVGWVEASGGRWAFFFPMRPPTTPCSGRGWMSWISSTGRRLRRRTSARLR